MTKKVEETVVEEVVVEEEEKKETKEDSELFTVIASGEKTITYTKEPHGFDLVVKFKLPTMSQKSTADMLYAKKYNKLLQDDDHLTTSQLLETARRRKTWTEEDEIRVTKVDADIIDTKELVQDEKNKKKKESLEAELAEFREEKFRLALKVGQITGTSIEVLSEQERTSYMLINCLYVIDASGESALMYPTRSALDEEQDLKRLETVLLEAKSFWSGEGLSDFLHLGD